MNKLEGISEEEFINFDTIKNMFYLSGAADGIISTQSTVRSNERVEVNISIETKNLNIIRLWANVFSLGSIEKNGTKLAIYTPEECLAVLDLPFINMMVLKCPEIQSFRILVQSILNCRANMSATYPIDLRKAVAMNNSFYRSISKRQNSLPIAYLREDYISGIFTASPKGTIRFEPPSKNAKNGRLIIQIATANPYFGQYMQRVYGGYFGVVKEGASYVWKLTGSNAKEFYEEIIKRHSPFPINIESSSQKFIEQ